MGAVIGGRYEILEIIGQGGMGKVFEGRDTKTDERVAIKALNHDLVEQVPDIVARFVREGEALRTLNHPNIVKMLAAFEENEQHYIVMEYVKGGTLRDLLKRQPQLPLDVVLNNALDLADALARAHRLQIVHRDLKPENVLLAEDGTPRLTDFGVARIANTTRMTEVGSVVGTISYLSPEACDGSSLVDERTDIWAFGVILYEVLTGQHPFEKSSPTGTLLSIIQDEPADILTLRPDVPAPFVDLINRMLVKDLDERIPSVRQVGAELEAMIRGINTPSAPLNLRQIAEDMGSSSRFAPTPISTELSAIQPIVSSDTRAGVETKVEPPAPTVAASPRNRRRIWMGIGAAVVVVAVALVALLVLSSREPAIALVDPVQPREIMVLVAQPEHLGGTERDIQRFIVEDLQQHFEELAFSTLRIRAYPEVLTSTERALKVAQANGATVVLWGNYDDSRVEMMVQVGDLSLYPDLAFGSEDFDVCANARIRLTDERNQTSAHGVLALMVMLHSYRGDSFEAGRMNAIREAIDAEPAEVIGSSATAHCMRVYALLKTDVEAALEEITAAIQLDPGHPYLYVVRPVVRWKLGLVEEAEEDLQTALRLAPDNWALPSYLMALSVEFFRGDHGEAIQRLDRVIELRPNDWMAYTLRSIAYEISGDLGQAKTDIDLALSFDPQANFAHAFAIGLALRDGRVVEAQTLLNEVLEKFPDPTFGERILVASLGEEAPQVSPLTPTIAAFTNLTLRQWREVIPNVEEAVQSGVLLDNLYFMKGLAYCNLREYADSDAAYTTGLEANDTHVMLHLMRAEARRNTGNLLGALNDVNAVTQGPLGDTFQPLIAASISGEVNCEKLLDVDLAAIMGEATN